MLRNLSFALSKLHFKCDGFISHVISKQMDSPKCLSPDKTCGKTVKMESSDQSTKSRLPADLEIIY